MSPQKVKASRKRRHKSKNYAATFNQLIIFPSFGDKFNGDPNDKLAAENWANSKFISECWNLVRKKKYSNFKHYCSRLLK